MKRIALWTGGIVAVAIAFWLQDSLWDWLVFGIPWWGYAVLLGLIVAYALWTYRSKSSNWNTPQKH